MTPLPWVRAVGAAPDRTAALTVSLRGHAGDATERSAALLTAARAVARYQHYSTLAAHAAFFASLAERKEVWQAGAAADAVRVTHATAPHSELCRSCAHACGTLWSRWHASASCRPPSRARCVGRADGRSIPAAHCGAVARAPQFSPAALATCLHAYTELHAGAPRRLLANGGCLCDAVWRRACAEHEAEEAFASAAVQPVLEDLFTKARPFRCAHSLALCSLRRCRGGWMAGSAAAAKGCRRCCARRWTWPPSAASAPPAWRCACALPRYCLHPLSSGPRAVDLCAGGEW